MPATPNRHASDSSEQHRVEWEILTSLQTSWGVQFEGQPDIDQPVKFDGFVDGEIPICVEAWAHQGASKDGQRKKVMRDFCKFLLVEKLLGKPCRKVFAVCDAEAIAFLQNSWMGRFADEFGIERVVVEISESARQTVRDAQKRQVR